MSGICANCGASPTRARQLCSACYQYWRVNGRERPLPLSAEAVEADLREYCRSVAARLADGDPEPWWVA